MDLCPKFIIEGENLILMKVAFHKDIVEDVKNVKGGGWFSFDNNAFTFSGSSHDFGPAKLEDIKACVKAGNVYTNNMCYNSIADRHDFFYNTGTELINLKD